MRLLQSRPGLRIDACRLERLEGLPLRPASARQVLGSLPDEAGPLPEPWEAPGPQSPPVTELDPGWVLNLDAPGRRADPLALIAARAWWPKLFGAQAEALQRQWRHAVAVSLAARRLARDAGDPEADRVARAGLLHGLGRWAVAAIEPQWLVDWQAEPDSRRRTEFERQTLGIEVSTLGRILAERWGCHPLIVDAAWLHDGPDRALNGCASDPARIAILQEAYAWAERTPWALSTTHPPGLRDPHAADPRLRLLIAEVQVRCGSAFIEPDASPHEERLARSNARLRLQLRQLRADAQSRDRFLETFLRSDPTDSPETWASNAGLCWCGEPGVTTARVVWTGPGICSPRDPAEASKAAGEPSASGDRPPSLVVPLGDRGRPCAEVHLWTDPGVSAQVPGQGFETAQQAWQAWATLVAERARLSRRLDEAVQVHRERVNSEELRLRQAKLEALAEFAAGAGHELNNPLAVIVGRAQLLLARETDPGATRSLQAILTQAQRAHRILRDLMYVARPPEPRPRFCQPEEIVRPCLRDLRESAEERGVQLLTDVRGIDAKVWADPDALRHVTEVLLRNALEATPKGGTIQFRLSTTADEALVWSVQDSGRGITAAEGSHLFDPFYCGRQAGRGLGLGLPRAARLVAQAGGAIQWYSHPGQGTTFHVHLPLAEPPRPPLAAESGTATPQACRPEDFADASRSY